ncbi:E3 ubiquitin-protein transferase MAEA-like [Impatiens glandulifera]|uniref:E3 ubiquitin-protein transferase MAEA-like n=1 Tax=Impatiens glandulifera TaxID=253017 RepID=UPI001FB13826|nr:E3 ubiquitin-protein transferase MAEA-like [Impatiens glandulifera]
MALCFSIGLLEACGSWKYHPRVSPAAELDLPPGANERGDDVDTNDRGSGGGEADGATVDHITFPPRTDYLVVEEEDHRPTDCFVAAGVSFCADVAELEPGMMWMRHVILLSFCFDDGKNVNNISDVPKTWTYLFKEYSLEFSEILEEMALLGIPHVSLLYKQWDYLVEQFKQEFCKLYGMTFESLLNIFLQAGLSALKTPFCYEDDCTKEDPLSQELFRKLAMPLPFSKQHHSKLVCYITKDLMDTENPPLVLPNGYVYSTKAMEEMARLNNGVIQCPRTGDICNFSSLVKSYIS